jgi:nucleoside-diphosphate-sugar epimerase
MRCLVTGGAGFIGSHLVDRLASDGCTVDVVDDLSAGLLDNLAGNKLRVVPTSLLEEFEKVETVARDTGTVLVMQGDFADPRVLSRIKKGFYTHIFHVAAIPRVAFSVENPVVTTDVNVLRTTQLIHACAGTRVQRIIFSSSSSVYGGEAPLPTPNTAAKRPKSPYALQKSVIEDFIAMAVELYGIDAVCLRYFNVFGPRQLGSSPYSTALSAWCDAIKTGRTLRSDGTGEQSRDLCYVDNVVQANVLAARASSKLGGVALNVACGDRTSNNEILAALLKRHPDAQVVSAPWRAGDVMHSHADVSETTRLVGYVPAVKFWDGFDRTLAWWDL